MEGVDRLNDLEDEMLVCNIMSRLDCTTKELITTTATISKRWKNLWTQLPHLIFSYPDDASSFGCDETDLRNFISFIDNTLNQCPTELNLKKFKLSMNYRYAKFKSRINSWIRYAISRNVEEVDLRLWDEGIGYPFIYDDELFFNNLCFKRLKVSECLFNPPNGAISWEKLKCLCILEGTFDEDLIQIILSGSPCLETLELIDCAGFGRIDVTSKSVTELVVSQLSEEDIDAIEINAPYISSLTIKGEVLRELVLLDVSSLIKLDLDYSVSRRKFEITHARTLRGLLGNLDFDRVKDVIVNDYIWELYSRLIADSDASGSDAPDGDQVEIGD